MTMQTLKLKLENQPLKLMLLASKSGSYAIVGVCIDARICFTIVSVPFHLVDKMIYTLSIRKYPLMKPNSKKHIWDLD